MSQVFVSRDADARIDPAIVEQAAIWIATLQSGTATEQQREACAAWRRSSPEHERAWRRMAGLGHDLRSSAAGAAPQLARRILLTPPQRQRRGVLKAVAGLAALGSLGYASRNSSTVLAWTADQHTGIGELRTLTLPDGSHIMLGSGSAVDMDTGHTPWTLTLLDGDLLVDQPHPAPLQVRVGAATLHAGAARYTVRHDAGAAPRLRIAVEAGQVQVHHAVQANTVSLDAGLEMHGSATAMEAPHPLSPYAVSWTRGLLMAERMALAAFANELDRYRPGVLRCDPAVAGLLVSGSFPLNRPDSVLAALQEVLPVRVQYRTQYWATLVAA